MRADNEMGVALCDVAPHLLFAVLLQRAREQHDSIAGIFKDLPRGKIMLLSKNFRGCHQRDLIPVLNGNNGSFESDDCFAGADIPLQETPHGRRFLHV